MNIALTREPVANLESAALILLQFEGSGETAPSESLKEHLKAAYESGEISGKSKDMTLLYNAPGFRSLRVLLAGAGKRDRFGTAELRKIMSIAVRYLKDRKIKNATLSLD